MARESGGRGDCGNVLILSSGVPLDLDARVPATAIARASSSHAGIVEAGEIDVLAVLVPPARMNGASC